MLKSNSTLSTIYEKECSYIKPIYFILNQFFQPKIIIKLINQKNIQEIKKYRGIVRERK